MDPLSLIEEATDLFGHDPNQQEILAYLTIPDEDVEDSDDNSLTLDNSELFTRFKNEFDEQSQGIIAIQQGQLQNAIIGVEGRIVNEALNKISKNAFESQDDVISAAQKKEALKELEMILQGFYSVIIPLYATKIIASRKKEFGGDAVFIYDNEIKQYVQKIAKMTAESHVDTVLSDIVKSANDAYKAAVEDEVTKLKIEGRDVTDADLVLARDNALKGASQTKIISAVKHEFAGNITQVRAKAIARTETNRAFTQSQYEADKQFIKENDLEKNAFKKWTTRSDNPCPICNDLASQPAIPFEKNFADLGDELSAVYTDANGKTKVQKQLVDFQELSAGNAHVNCSCVYILIIK